MDEEVAAILSEMQVASVKKIVNVDFHIGNLFGNKAVVVRCGIGKVNAAICAQTLINLYAVDLIINIGVAGAIHKDLEICDIIISSGFVYHDFDATAFGYPRGAVPGMGFTEFESDPELVEIVKKASLEVVKNAKVYTGRISSGDQFVASRDLKTFIWDNFRAMCAEMEGAAIAHACYLNKIPFVAIRSISDKADDFANETYKKHMETAIKNTSDIAKKVVETIN
jgi:adenosylhomocysteine nucleosidase